VARTVKALLATAVVGAGIFALPTAALATSSAGTRTWPISEHHSVQTVSNSTKTTFVINSICNLVQVCQVGHGSVTRDGTAWSLTVCDDRADGIGPYIDRDGGSYGDERQRHLLDGGGHPRALAGALGRQLHALVHDAVAHRWRARPWGERRRGRLVKAFLVVTRQGGPAGGVILRQL